MPKHRSAFRCAYRAANSGPSSGVLWGAGPLPVSAEQREAWRQPVNVNRPFRTTLLDVVAGEQETGHGSDFAAARLAFAAFGPVAKLRVDPL